MPSARDIAILLGWLITCTGSVLAFGAVGVFMAGLITLVLAIREVK